MDGLWIVGGVEKTDQRKMFMITVERRTMPVMNRIITRFVKPGSIIYTDCFLGYNDIENLGQQYIHKTVNHSIGFLIDDIHTNTIEGKYKYKFSSIYINYIHFYLGTWNGIKMNIAARNRTRKNMPWNLVEALWRRKHSGNIWGGLIKTLREVSFSNATLNEPLYTEDLLQPGDLPSVDDEMQEEGEEVETEEEVEVEEEDDEDYLE